MRKKAAVMDIECYRDYFLVMFKNLATGNTRHFELFEGQDLDILTLNKILRNYTILTFNGRNYDIPILTLALSGASNIDLKRASDAIIKTNLKPWVFEEKYGVYPPKCLDHIDLIEVAPGQASLKIYGGRLHSKKMQDLPIEPDASISPDDRQDLITYCGNDLQTTIDLYNKLRAQIELREQMSEQYNVDVRSKSDAQIAEAVIRHEIEKARGSKVYKPDFVKGQSFRYRAPDYISFTTPSLTRVFEAVKASVFTVSDEGGVEMPDALESARIRIGDSVYRMGIGGLHSSESTVARQSDDDYTLIDRDVASYYPSIILNLNLFPKQLGKEFLRVYRTIYDRRLRAKASGDKVVADSLKIVINGSFGKFGSRWSILYSPDLLIQTTVTGQLCLLMLIEAIENAGIRVVSANTDGIVIYAPNDRMDELNTIVREWESRTDMVTEDTEYRALFSRDVNNYIALKPDGGVKCKGAYASAGLQKNPTAAICVEATVEFLKTGKPVSDYIRACSDITKFVVIRQVKGGGQYTGLALDNKPTLRVMTELLEESGWVALDPEKPTKSLWVLDGDNSNLEYEIRDAYDQLKSSREHDYLGKAVRWYYSDLREGCITYKTNGNKVPKSEGARPLMELPDELPGDIDHRWYISEAKSILADIGADEFSEYITANRDNSDLEALI